MSKTDREASCFDPIGLVRCSQFYRYEAARQPALAPENEAEIVLYDRPGYRDALSDLAGFERIWVIYEFHLNESWQPLVQPPREGMARLGVFATRSPHRPNRIGLSCVELVEVTGLTLRIRRHDLLDKTPVLDLKPYLPYADAFPEAQAGWVDTAPLNRHRVEWTETARIKAAWLLDAGGLDAVNFAAVQLGTDPTDADRKRVRPLSGEDWEIAYRTFRIRYRLAIDARHVQIVDLYSGYSDADLAPDSRDRYGDKPLHRDFLAQFPSSRD